MTRLSPVKRTVIVPVALVPVKNSVITGIARTPIGKYGGELTPLRAVELGGNAVGAALKRSKTDPAVFDQVLFGHVLQAGEGQITARQAAVAGGLPMTVPSVTINKVWEYKAWFANNYSNMGFCCHQIVDSSVAEFILRRALPRKGLLRNDRPALEIISRDSNPNIHPPPILV